MKSESQVIAVRMREDGINKLERLMEKLNMSKTEVIFYALDKLEQQLGGGK